MKKPQPRKEPVDETWSIGTFTRGASEDEPPSIIAVRELSKDERVQALADAALIQAVAPLAPYARVQGALEDLDKLVERLSERTDDRLSNNARQRAARSLRAVARALSQLPDELAEAFGGKLGENFDRESVVRELGEPPLEYTLSCVLDSVPADQLEMVRDEEGADLVLMAPGVSALGEAMGVGLPARRIAVVGLAHEGAFHAARMVAHWLIALREPVRDASLRIQKLGAEVVEGPPAIIKVIFQASDGEGDEVSNMTPSPLPLTEIYATQAALRTAEALLSDAEPLEPRRAGSGMLAEEILSHVAWAEDGALHPVDEESEDQEEEPGVRPADLGALLRHVEAGVAKLEQAWSRALEDEPAQLFSEWRSLLVAISSELAARDSELDAGEAEMTWPPDAEQLAALELSPEPAIAGRQLRLAQVEALSALADAVQILATPTKYRVVPAAGRLDAQWSSGAFAEAIAAARHVRWLLALPEGGGAVPPEDVAQRALDRAGDSWNRGDPEATLLHSLTVIDTYAANSVGNGQQALADAEAFVAVARDARSRLASGKAVDPGAVVVLASATLDLASDLRDADG